MAGSVNKVILVGNLGRDPEVKRGPSGDPIVNLNIATSESWRDKQTGERREKTEWHRVVIFNESLAKVAEDYLRKGSKIYLEGQLETQEFQDKNGEKRWTTKIVLQRYRGALTILDSREDNERRGTSQGDTDTRPKGTADDPRTQRKPSGAADDLKDDDIPF